MSEKDDAGLRRELKKVGADLARSSDVIDRRGRWVAAARAKGDDGKPKMTWRQIASLLGMTERGVIKSQQAWEAANPTKVEAK